jgi:hypothetical protein
LTLQVTRPQDSSPPHLVIDPFRLFDADSLDIPLGSNDGEIVADDFKLLASFPHPSEVDVSWEHFPPGQLKLSQGDALHEVHLRFSGSSGSTAITLVMRPTDPEQPLVGLVPDQVWQHPIDFQEYRDFESQDDSSSQSSDDFDLEQEMETLHLLEAQAHNLSVHIAAKKKAIAYALQQDQDKLCLKHLIKECDGIVCAAKAVLRRICDKVGVRTDPSSGFAGMQKSQMQQLVAGGAEKHHNCTDGESHGAQAANIPLMMSQSGAHAFSGFDLSRPSNPLFKALSVIAAVLGLTAILTFIKRKFSPMRTRVERLADREERRNARAYRRAARRALMRKRWNNFLSTINCFRCDPEPVPQDYEEKRALILQDAFLEQDLEQAEKGEIMEAEIRELRHAHEIVSSLVQVDEHRYAMVTPIHDPPPPMVPLPYTPRTSRSRANSTFTLPSYTSEMLPDYSSQPPDTDSESSVVNGYTPSTSESHGRQSPFSPVSESSLQTRYTPTSSILETSPRPSEETLRTRPSRDTPRR